MAAATAAAKLGMMRHTSIGFARKPMVATGLSVVGRQTSRLTLRPSLCSSGQNRGPLGHVQRSEFHHSARRSLLPPPPQRVDGTANDPVVLPDPSPTHGSYHWTFERIISAALVPLTIAPFAAGSLNPVMDAVLCGTILVHSHVGFQSVIIDYIPKRRLPKAFALFWWGLRAGTLAVAVGLYEFETNDVGVTEAIKKIWTA